MATERISTKLKKNDTVSVITGKEKGKTGRVLKIDSKKERVVVEGLNMVKKAKKPKSQNDKGGIVSVEGSIAISNLKLVCKKCGPSKASWKIVDGKKTRVCKKCGEVI